MSTALRRSSNPSRSLDQTGDPGDQRTHFQRKQLLALGAAKEPLEGRGRTTYTSRRPNANDGDPMINIRYEPNDVVVRIPKEFASSAYVQGFLEHLRVEAALERSRITDDQIEALSEQVKSDWWAANKEGFLKGSSD